MIYNPRSAVSSMYVVQDGLFGLLEDLDKCNVEGVNSADTSL